MVNLFGDVESAELLKSEKYPNFPNYNLNYIPEIFEHKDLKLPSTFKAFYVAVSESKHVWCHSSLFRIIELKHRLKDKMPNAKHPILPQERI